MSKHTPGPWEVRGPTPDKNPAYRVVDLSEKVARTIASVQIMAHGHSGNDARLIAAAPELLEALQRLVDNVDGGEFISITRIQEARAAIAKAVQA